MSGHLSVTPIKGTSSYRVVGFDGHREDMLPEEVGAYVKALIDADAGQTISDGKRVSRIPRRGPIGKISRPSISTLIGRKQDVGH